MFDLLMRDAGGADVPVPLPGRAIVFAGQGGAMLARLHDGSVVAVGGGGGIGSAGPAGPAGPAGVAGAVGPVGPAGPAGPAGVAGAVGPAGPQGLQGVAGPAGGAGGGGAVAAFGVPVAAPGGVSLFAETVQSSVSAVPVMTAVNAPSGLVSVSTEYQAGMSASVFSVSGNGWITNGAALPQWIGYAFAGQTKIMGYGVAPWDVDTFPTRCFKAWKFQGSNDGVLWVDLDQRSAVTGWAIGVEKVFSLAATANYARYRLLVSENNGDTYTGARRVRLYGEMVALMAMMPNGRAVRLAVDL